MNDRATRGLALYAALLATFAETHPACDQIVQDSDDAKGKGEPGPKGHAACARHVATYTAGQTITAALVTTALGYRMPPAPGLPAHSSTAPPTTASTGANPQEVPTQPLDRQGGYLKHATAQRREGVIDEGGPGTALFEMDQAAHRLIGVAAATVTTCLAIRADHTR